MSEPLRVRWDRTVIHSTGIGDDTIVCCLDQHGHPVAVFLDDEHREALALSLLDPNGDMDQADDTDAMTPQQCPAGKHADWAVDGENAHSCPWCEVDRLKAEFREAMDNYHGAAAEAKKLRTKAEREHIELRDRRTEDLNLRGLLAPDGLPRRVPMELGTSLVPAVEWLLAEVATTRAKTFTEAARVVETLGHSDDAVAVLDNIAAGITEYAAPTAALGAGQ